MRERSLLTAAVLMFITAALLSCNARGSMKEVEIRVEGMT